MMRQGTLIEHSRDREAKEEVCHAESLCGAVRRSC
jgi:hypothetical protein